MKPFREHPPTREIIELPSLAKYIKDWGQPSDLGVVAIDQETNQPVGATWLRLFDAENAGYGFVDSSIPELSIALLPSFRGQGVGTALMTRLIDAAKEVGVPGISLSVNGRNPARHLYQRLGFETKHVNGDTVTMLKKLEQS
ncbi:MAG: GNAT family N-acetyltransferase [Chloroflexi bacterium]|nr:MAG: GNAT family N-acetyltransferase [Chloroflexota bacterium]